jgi:hypothetical protein
MGRQAQLEERTMKTHGFRLVAFALFLALYMAASAPLTALPIPSKSSSDQSLMQRQAELAKIEGIVSQPEISAALASQGFSTDDVNERLAQLSPEEIHSLSQQLNQLQAAGSQVPTYIWILIGILLGVLIIGAL